MAAARLLRATAYIKAAAAAAAAAMSHSRPEDDEITLLLLLLYIEHVAIVVIFRNDREPMRGRCQKSPKNHRLSAKTLHEFLDAIQKAENVSLARDDGGAAVTDNHLYMHTTLCTRSTHTHTHNNMLHRYLTVLYGRVYIHPNYLLLCVSVGGRYLHF